jgi:hypothetical protein
VPGDAGQHPFLADHVDQRGHFAYAFLSQQVIHHAAVDVARSGAIAPRAVDRYFGSA